MKLKILVVPAIIVICIVIIIWYLVPEYKATRADLDSLSAVKAKVSDIQEKNGLIVKLNQDLKSDINAQETVMNFVPAQKQEEGAIDNINFIASGEGLAVLNISVLPVIENVALAAPVQPVADNEGGVSKAAVLPEPSEFRVDVGVSGDYGKIRSFIEKMSGLKRYNNIDDLKITPIQVTQTTGAKSAPVSGSLQADVSFVFDYFTKDKSIITADNEIFADGKFDIATIDSISQKMQTSLVNLTVGAYGKPNPFAP